MEIMVKVRANGERGCEWMQKFELRLMILIFKVKNHLKL